MPDGADSMVGEAPVPPPPGATPAVRASRWFLGVALGTFHTTLLSLLVLQFAFRGGGLGGALAELNTLVGLGLFGALWVLVTAASMLALRNLDFTTLSAGQALGSGARWGGGFGAAVVLVPFVLAAPVVLVLSVMRGGFQPVALVLVPVFVLFATAAAFLVGATLGSALALVDHGLLRASWLLVWPSARVGRPEDVSEGNTQ